MDRADFLKNHSNNLILNEFPKHKNGKGEKIIIPKAYRQEHNITSGIHKNLSFLFNGIKSGLEAIKFDDGGEAFRDANGNISEIWYKIHDYNDLYAHIQYYAFPDDEYFYDIPGSHVIIDLKTFTRAYKDNDKILSIIENEPEQYLFLPYEKFAERDFINECLLKVREGVSKRCAESNGDEKVSQRSKELIACVKTYTKECNEKIVSGQDLSNLNGEEFDF